MQHLVAEQDQFSMQSLIWQLKYPFSPVSFTVIFELKEKKSSKSSSFSTKKVSSKQNIISYRQNRMCWKFEGNIWFLSIFFGEVFRAIQEPKIQVKVKKNLQIICLCYLLGRRTSRKHTRHVLCTEVSSIRMWNGIWSNTSLCFAPISSNKTAGTNSSSLRY